MSNANDAFVNAANPPKDNDFLDSLDTLTIDDVVPPHRKRPARNGISVSKIYRMAIVFLCCAVFLYCVSELITIVKGYEDADVLYGELQEDFWTIMNTSTNGNVSQMVLSLKDIPLVNYDDVLEGGAPDYTPQIIGPTLTSSKFQKYLSIIQKLRDRNSDTYGNLLIKGTVINYPLVQHSDNDFYLEHSFDKGPLPAGAIFIDCRNDRTLTKNKNIVIYGHNMTNKSMFYDITKYVLDKDFFMDPEKNPEIATFDGLYTFTVFSAYPTVADDPYFRTHFANDDAFVKFCKEREERSLYHKEGIEFDKDDIIITFSTCILGQPDGRYAVHAVLTKVEK